MPGLPCTSSARAVPALGFEKQPRAQPGDPASGSPAAKPDLLIVGLGAPKQELWLAAHRHEIQAPVALAIGATIDFLAGETIAGPGLDARRRPGMAAPRAPASPAASPAATPATPGSSRSSSGASGGSPSVGEFLRNSLFGLAEPALRDLFALGAYRRIDSPLHRAVKHGFLRNRGQFRRNWPTLA